MLTDDIVIEKREYSAAHINSNEGDLKNQSPCSPAAFEQENGMQGNPSRL